MNETALKELIYRMADDLLVLGHRNSEWTGLGPLLEEDIAFSSMAQDKIGQSLALYQMLHQLGEQEPDTVAFMRHAAQFHNCILVELPNGEYDFSLVRHFLFDTADALRWDLLRKSSYEPLSLLANKVAGELNYHVIHAKAWIKRLGTANEESVTRMQKSLDYALPFACGMFEISPHEDALIREGIFPGEKQLRELWQPVVTDILSQTRLKISGWDSVTPVYGGRTGKHTEFLEPLLNEMSEVFRTDPGAEW